ncbi:MAG: hypothetical protein JOY64_16485 [Alphaproteobacteria bacterium]|nr:hypothetical protein [Alphaproteobacteria bacterium]
MTNRLLGVISALPEEFAHLSDQSGTPSDIGGFSFWRGRIAGPAAVRRAATPGYALPGGLITRLQQALDGLELEPLPAEIDAARRRAACASRRRRDQAS